MNRYRFLVTHEGTVEASDESEARAWAAEEVEQGVWPITHTEVERIAHDDKPDRD